MARRGGDEAHIDLDGGVTANPLERLIQNPELACLAPPKVGRDSSSRAFHCVRTQSCRRDPLAAFHPDSIKVPFQRSETMKRNSNLTPTGAK